MELVVEMVGQVKEKAVAWRAGIVGRVRAEGLHFHGHSR